MKPRTFFMCFISLACMVAAARADINFFPSNDRGEDRREEREEARERRREEKKDREHRLPKFLADTRVDLSAVLGKDFIGSPSFNQAVDALGNDQPFFGFGWEAIVDHVGFGGQYLANYHEDDAKEWWLDWNCQPVYLSYHLLGTRSVIDPFVNGGMGCAGRVYLGDPDEYEGQLLALTLYPFVGAGASLCLDHFKIGAKVDYALGRSRIPATDIAEYPLGRFQVSVLAGVTLGAGRGK